MNANETLQSLHRPSPQESMRGDLSRHAEESSHDERYGGAERRVGDGNDGVYEDAGEEGVPVGLRVSPLCRTHVEVIEQPRHARSKKACEKGEGLRSRRGDRNASSVHVKRGVDDCVGGANQQNQGDQGRNGGCDLM